MSHSQQVVATETAAVRRQARVLLVHLQANRVQSTQRLDESGAHDPMARITGHSALDSAIMMTTRMITNMDRLLADLQQTPNGEAAPLVAERGRPR